jgi:hypothetical protein
MFIAENELLDHQLDSQLIRTILKIRLDHDPGGIASPAPTTTCGAGEDKGRISVLEAAQSVPFLPPVAKSELIKWFNGWAKKAGGEADSEARVWAAAREQFPHRLVTRGVIRDLRGSRPRGRPKSAAK